MGGLLLVGCGNMGGALLGGWLARGMAGGDIAVVEPNEAARHGASAQGVRAVARPTELPPASKLDTVVVAVKPQEVAAVLPAYGAFAAAGALFVSVAAGTRIAAIERVLGGRPAVVRTMPNTPALVRRGITVACANAAVSAAQRAACDALLQAVGAVAWVEDEGLMDAVTAVSGSGPAYAFLLIECLADAGVAAGLARDLADRLALASIAGAGELARSASDPPAALRRRVTSPGGTTEAALRVLMAQDGMGQLLRRAVAAATERSRALAG
ncbi:MAG: pyrroline-5-carboxylate reductase [Alphaproteobacteria bacterium]|nr:pyrroline-5-carboxylate reductase [Alphaproteobacteria bacterium]